MTKKFELGPMQKKWIKALRSGKFKQARNWLRVRKQNKEYRYCCLGVANKVCRLGETNASALNHTFDVIGLRDRVGSGIGKRNLTALNDGDRLTFRQIASRLERYPSAYFTRSA